ncbi:MAG: sulfatase activating formylglycine-generating enzyme [Paraglaciecola psychrophila]|jgi:formylglycine-generating enzyme required for sulfatase activity
MSSNYDGDTVDENTAAGASFIAPPGSPTGQFKTVTASQFSPPPEGVARVKKRISGVAAGAIVVFLLALLVLGYLRASTAVLIEVVPVQATVTIDGFSPQIARSYLLLPGEYTLLAKAPGYADKLQLLAVDRGDSQQFSVQLQPLPGHINIESNVSQLQVSIDGAELDVSLPGLLNDIAQGNYQLTFSSARHFSKIVDVTVEGFDKIQSLRVVMQPAWGELMINSEPAGAQVRVDGNEMGLTPLNVQILQTGSELQLSKAGYNRWSKIVTVKAGEKEVYPEIKLDAGDATVTLTSEPSAAKVTVNGLFVGQTPLEIALAPGIKHQLKLFSEGYQVLNKTVQLKAEQRQSYRWPLQPQLGAVQLRVRPVGAQVRVNGKLLGSGDRSLNLIARKHLIEVSSDGFVSQQQFTVPKPGLTQSLSFNLLTEQQSYWAKFPQQIAAGGIAMKLMRPDTVFMMGTARRESARRSNEIQRNVRLDKPFYIAKYETTNSQYQQFDRQHNSLQMAGISFNGNQQPVVNVGWLQAAKFCNWLSRKQQLTPVYTIVDDELLAMDMTLNGYRLPTEAEWAWLARFDKKASLRRYIWGDRYPPTAVVANYADARSSTLLGKSVPGYDDGHIVSAPVGSYPADARGMFDVSGNVSEWVHDFYSIAANRGEPVLNPSGPATGRDHVIRGASWRHGSRTEIRLSYREFGNTGKLDIGFRVARNIE